MSQLPYEPHSLRQKFTFWVTYFKKSKDKQLEEFEDNLIPIHDFSTVEAFWSIYERMKRPNSLPRGCEFLLFKTGIKPLWEDVSNTGGGRFYFSMKKNQVTNRVWEDLQIAFLLATPEFEKLNGIVLNVRQAEVFLSVWTRKLDADEMGLYREWLRKSLDFPHEQLLEYKLHPNNEQLIQKQEKLTQEEIDRIKREAEFERKRQEDVEKKRARTGPNSQLGKTTRREQDQIARLIQDMDEDMD